MRGMSRRFLVTLVMLAALVCSGDGWAQQKPLTQAEREAELQASMDEANRTLVAGPADIALVDQAKLSVPQGMGWIPQAPAIQLMRALGNVTSSSLLGIVVSTGPEPWMVTARYVGEGYVNDSEAREWNADELLRSLQEGTRESNAERVARGYAALEVTGWAQPPRYDSHTHRLTWAATLRHQNEPSSPESDGVNYNTRTLGREGYFSLTLLTNLNRLEQDKPAALTLLSNLNYNPGKRYEDFNTGTDRVAEYGIAALLGVAAAKKLGMLAIIGAFVAKFAKLFLLAGAAVIAVVVKLVRRAKTPAA